MKKLLALIMMIAFLGACTSSSGSEEGSEESESVEASESAESEEMEVEADSTGVSLDSLANEAADAAAEMEKDDDSN